MKSFVRSLRSLCLGLAVAASVALLAGCGGKCENLGADRCKLDETLKSDKPVLVDFYKWGCASCLSVDPVKDQLADEYRGRAVVARFWMAHFWFAPTDWEVFKRYSFGFFPTVILFVDGKEKCRWVWDTNADNYRKELDKLVPPAASQPDKCCATQPHSSPG
jgi:thioredoxin 1